MHTELESLEEIGWIEYCARIERDCCVVRVRRRGSLRSRLLAPHLPRWLARLDGPSAPQLSQPTDDADNRTEEEGREERNRTLTDMWVLQFFLILSYHISRSSHPNRHG